MKRVTKYPGKEREMKKYLLVFYGGKMETDPKKVQAGMEIWMKWFKDAGKAVVDMGTPTMAAKTVSAKGAKNGVAGDPITGYSIFQADNIDGVVEMAKKSPQISAGGQIAIYEMMPM
jgi:hypothetical protein